MRMREVKDGCKLCGKRMLTDRSPLIRRTCDACKAKAGARGQSQDRGQAQGPAPRREGQNPATALPALRQGHHGRIPPRRSRRLDPQVLRRQLPSGGVSGEDDAMGIKATVRDVVANPNTRV